MFNSTKSTELSTGTGASIYTSNANSFDQSLYSNDVSTLKGSSQSVESQGLNPNPNLIFSSAAVNTDFNGDGKTDKIWRNSQTGEVAIWLMDGATPAGAALPSRGAEWDYKIADLNGDGKTDLIWRNKNTGANEAWVMDGGNIVADTMLPTTDSNWDFTVGDTNGDRKSD